MLSATIRLLVTLFVVLPIQVLVVLPAKALAGAAKLFALTAKLLRLVVRLVIGPPRLALRVIAR